MNFFFITYFSFPFFFPFPLFLISSCRPRNFLSFFPFLGFSLSTDKHHVGGRRRGAKQLQRSGVRPRRDGAVLGGRAGGLGHEAASAGGGTGRLQARRRGAAAVGRPGHGSGEQPVGIDNRSFHRSARRTSRCFHGL
jgi:hypothetical protein